MLQGHCSASVAAGGSSLLLPLSDTFDAIPDVQMYVSVGDVRQMSDIELNIERNRSYSNLPSMGDLKGEDLSQSQINLV